MPVCDPTIAKIELIRGAAHNAFRGMRGKVSERITATEAAVQNLCQKEPLLHGVSVDRVTYTHKGKPGEPKYHLEIRIRMNGLNDKEGVIPEITVEISPNGGKRSRAVNAARIKRLRQIPDSQRI